MTDISQIESIDREVELKHPATDQGLGWIFQIRSPYSEEVQKAERKNLNKRLGKKKGNLTVEALDAIFEDKLMAAIYGWRFEGDATFDGEQPEFSKSKLKEIVRNPKHKWIKEFLRDELEDFGSFFEG